MLKQTIFAALLLAASASPAQRGGTLVSADPVGETPPGTQAWRIRYWTHDDRGRPQQVTGMVVAPREAIPSQPRRVIAWTHGTWGLEDKCAPSASPKFFEATAAIDAVRRGYVIAAPDYPGLGSAGPHPFLVGTVTARSTLDAVRASGAIPGAAAGTRFVVWGESQGGHAALWTGQLAGVEGAGLTLLGVAAAAPVTELAANFREAGDPNTRAFFTALVATSWSDHYGVPLKLGRRGTPAIMRRFASNCISVDTTPRLGALLGMLALRRDLKGVDFPALAPWSGYIAANSAAPVQKVPVLIAQNVADPLVAPAVTRRFATRLCANRVRVRWIDLPGKDHATAARQSAAETIDWIDARFAAARAPDDCATLD